MLVPLPVLSQPYAVSDNQSKSVLQIPFKPVLGLKRLSLLDPERFTMKNQYMMNFSSVGGNGSMMGMYINTMEYRFNMPLTMRLRVAYQSQSAQLFGDKQYTGNPDLNGGRLFIPSFDMVYKPFKNTVIGLFYRDYSTMNPYYYNPYGSSFNRFMYSPFMGN